MGLLSALLGEDEPPIEETPLEPEIAEPEPAQLSNANEQAIARYRFLLKTLPAEALQSAFETAFSKIAPAQLELAYSQMYAMSPPHEAAELQNNPAALAHSALIHETRVPGFMEKSFGGANAMGGNEAVAAGVTAGNLMTSLAAGVVSSPAAREFFSDSSHESAFAQSEEAQSVEGGVVEYSLLNFNQVGREAAQREEKAVEAVEEIRSEFDELGASQS